MGLAKIQGSLTTISTPDASRLVQDDLNVKPTPDELLSQRPYILDSLSHKTGLSFNRNDPVIQSLVGYAAGTPVIVTYYHQHVGYAREKSHLNDATPALDNVHQSWLRIENFEFKLRGGMNYNYDTEGVLSTVTGSAIVYPGFMPLIGDMFLYVLEEGTLGLFKLNRAPNRLVIRSSTCHEIEFELDRIVSQTDIDKIEETVTDVAYFDKRRFLLEPGSLLTSDEFMLTQDINRHLNVLTRYYQDKFLNKLEYQSYIRPDNVYDPYIVKFLHHILRFNDINTYPMELTTEAPHWEESIWYLMLNPDMIPVDLLVLDYNIEIYKCDFQVTRINGLLNRPYVKLNKDGKTPYIFANETWFYDHPEDVENEDHLRVVDLLVKYCNTRKVDTELLLSLTVEHRKWEPIDQFYWIPILIFMLRQLQESMRTGRSRLDLK